MKNNFFLFLACLACFSIGVIHSYTKDAATPRDPSTIRETKSYTEEFKNVSALISGGGWTATININDSVSFIAPWIQGYNGQIKVDSINTYGFTAYSYKSSQDEFAYSYLEGMFSNFSTSSWLITPVLSVKNGDKISFYTRGDATGNYIDRMQVLMDKSTSPDVGDSVNSVGSFTTVLFNINAAQALNGYPTTWTKYEYTFSGISGKMNTRIAFRHYVADSGNRNGIGIDVFRFQVN